MDIRLCPRCQTRLPAASYYTRSNGSPVAYCKTCWRTYYKERRGKIRADLVITRLAERTGYRTKQLKAMLASQNGRCAISGVQLVNAPCKRDLLAIDLIEMAGEPALVTHLVALLYRRCKSKRKLWAAFLHTYRTAKYHDKLPDHKEDLLGRAIRADIARGVAASMQRRRKKR